MEVSLFHPPTVIKSLLAAVHIYNIFLSWIRIIKCLKTVKEITWLNADVWHLGECRS